MKIVQGELLEINNLDTTLVLLDSFQGIGGEVHAPVDILQRAPDLKSIIVKWIYPSVKEHDRVTWYIRFPGQSVEASHVLMDIICSVFERIVTEYEGGDASVFSGLTLLVENEENYIFEHLQSNLPGAKKPV